MSLRNLKQFQICHSWLIGQINIKTTESGIRQNPKYLRGRLLKPLKPPQAKPVKLIPQILFFKFGGHIRAFHNYYEICSSFKITFKRDDTT